MSTRSFVKRRWIIHDCELNIRPGDLAFTERISKTNMLLVAMEIFVQVLLRCSCAGRIYFGFPCFLYFKCCLNNHKKLNIIFYYHFHQQMLKTNLNKHKWKSKRSKLISAVTSVSKDVAWNVFVFKGTVVFHLQTWEFAQNSLFIIYICNWMFWRELLDNKRMK